ncbi:MAG: hypothetical protein GTO18_22105 [Anaerolineales bacterium]|nr:hypothetical protein [Anaerolineales bacterium]
MKQTKIEPGLLQVFRIFVGIRLFLALVVLRLQASSGDPRVRFYLILMVTETAVLLVYLVWPWLRDTLGGAYLPIALIYATIGPIVEHAWGMVLRQAGLLGGDNVTGGVWLLVLLLIVPFILVSWQYKLGTVIAYCIGTALFELLLTVPIANRIGLDPTVTTGIVFVRTLLFLLIGIIIVRLMNAQREQRAALEQANLQLAHHATTIEQLATSRERVRLARELHDTLAHTLSGLAVQLEAINALWETDPESAHDMLEGSLTATRDGLQETRRAIQALRATPLDDLGLILALRGLAESAADRANLILDLSLPEHLNELDPELEQGIYRIAEQAITNTTLHANADHLTVQIDMVNGQLRLTVSDDGCGFNLESVMQDEHYGLSGMQERAEMIGGKLEIESQPEQGTKVQLIVEDVNDPSSDMR